jgi:hypothetical protein
MQGGEGSVYTAITVSCPSQTDKTAVTAGARTRSKQARAQESKEGVQGRRSIK